MTFLSYHNLGFLWEWLDDLWNAIFGGFDWAEPIYAFLVDFFNIFRDLFTFTF